MPIEATPSWSRPAAEDNAAAKVIRLLLAFTNAPRPATASHLARSARLSSSTAHRLLLALELEGLAERLGRGWVAGTKLRELTTSAGGGTGRNLADVARPWLVEGAAHTQGCALHVVVLEGSEVIYLDRIGGPRTRLLPTHPGLRLPAHLTAAGRSLRRQHVSSAPDADDRAGNAADGAPVRVAYDRGEALPGVSCVAAPVLRRGVAVGAISVTGHSDAFDAVSMGRVVVWVAGRITIDLSSRPVAPAAGPH